MLSSIKAAAVLAFIGAASAAPTAARQAPNYPPTSLSDNFRLVANVTSSDLTFNDYVLTSYHIGAGTAYAVLVPNTTFTTGRIFYLNGTAEEVRYHNADVLSDSGSDPLFPSGVIINGDGTVSINAGLGEPGIGLTQFPDPISELSGKSAAGLAGEFYACQQELFPGANAVQLLFKELGVATPEGCSDVSLLAQCSEGSGLDHPNGNTVNCYADVAGIDWTVYSAY